MFTSKYVQQNLKTLVKLHEQKIDYACKTNYFNLID